MVRIDGRQQTQPRPVRFTVEYLDYAASSVLIETGRTRVLCAASVEEKVPPFLENSGSGWVTAEYAMLPCSTQTRTPRERSGRISGRTQEIQRLIGRSLRAALDLHMLGARTITLDCDVIQADGGTRTASITGAYVALHHACTRLVRDGLIAKHPVHTQVAATSVGIVQGEMLLDLCYEEDAQAEVDFNVVMTAAHELIEIQGTGERNVFSRATMNKLIDLAEQGIAELHTLQKEYL
jgi:ribonuclease PH